MITIAVVIGIIVLFITVRKVLHKTLSEEVSSARQLMHSCIFRSREEWLARMNTCREETLWMAPISDIMIGKIRRYILLTLRQLKPTNWENYFFTAIQYQMSYFYVYLSDEGTFDFTQARGDEMQGIKDAVDAIENTGYGYTDTLREYFHDIMTSVAASPRKNNECYFRGQMRVVSMLRSFQASTGKFTHTERCTKEGSRVGLFGQLASYFHWIAVERQKNRLTIDRGYAIIEFDLERIKQVNTFRCQGSLLNALFLYLMEMISAATGDSAPEHRLVSEQKYDARRVGYASENGIIWLVKCTALVQEFPHRLYIEFESITPDVSLFRYLHSCKLYLEAND